MLKSESKCSPTYPTIRVWSGKMRKLGLQFRYWLTYYRYHTKNTGSKELLHQCASNASLHHNNTTTKEAITQICKLRTEIREMKKNHKELRQKILQELAEEYASKKIETPRILLNRSWSANNSKNPTETSDMR